MDLRETSRDTVRRHPWELARVQALRAIERKYGLIRQAARTLDIGCGDGFLIEALCGDSKTMVDAVDVNLTDEQLQKFAQQRPLVQFHNNYALLREKAYALVTMFDVLEHVHDETGFLRDRVLPFSQPGGYLFCTVPSFQFLYGAHDRFLHHQRRYSRSGLRRVLESANLQVVASGYLFSLLLPVRGLMVWGEKCLGISDKEPGIGHWRGGSFITSIIRAGFVIDNWILLRLTKMGIVIPGLTVWAICKTPR